MKIAIDGTAASGKGTLARRLANRLGYDYLDTGLIYRGVALKALNAGVFILPENAKYPSEEATIDDPSIKILTSIADELTLPVPDCPELRSNGVSRLATMIASLKEIRQALIQKQRDFANFPPSNSGVVLDGRDIGSVILPDADFKFFIDAQPLIRAKRRFEEFKASNSSQTQEIILKNLVERDRRDQMRQIAPLKRLPEALFIDSSSFSADEVLQIALNYINGLS